MHSDLIHVMHVIDSLALGGAERMLVEIANATNSNSYRVSVCITRSGIDYTEELKDGITLHVLDRKSRFDPHGFGRLANLINKQRVDILHVHGRSSFSFVAFANLLGIVRIPIVLHDHEGWIEVNPSVPFWLKTIGKYKVAQYVGVHEYMHEWAQSAGIPEERTNIIKNGLDPSRFHNLSPAYIRREFRINSGVILGVMVGGIRRQKGLDLLVEAVRYCSDIEPVKFLIVGSINEPDYYRECQELIHALGLKNHFLFTGPRSDIPEILTEVDFAILPSRSESGPLVLIEYMLSKMPVAAFETGSVSQQAVKLGMPGFVPPGDIDALGKTISDLIHLTLVDRQSRGSTGYKIACNHYDIKDSMPEWYRVYEDALRH